MLKRKPSTEKEKYIVLSPKKLGISQEPNFKEIINKKDVDFYKVRGYNVYRLRKVS